MQSMSFDIWYNMTWYMWYDVIYDRIWCDTIWDDMIYEGYSVI